MPKKRKGFGLGVSTPNAKRNKLMRRSNNQSPPALSQRTTDPSNIPCTPLPDAHSIPQSALSRPTNICLSALQSTPPTATGDHIPPALLKQLTNLSDIPTTILQTSQSTCNFVPAPQSPRQTVQITHNSLPAAQSTIPTTSTTTDHIPSALPQQLTNLSDISTTLLQTAQITHNSLPAAQSVPQTFQNNSIPLPATQSVPQTAQNNPVSDNIPQTFQNNSIPLPAAQSVPQTFQNNSIPLPAAQSVPQTAQNNPVSDNIPQTFQNNSIPLPAAQSVPQTAQNNPVSDDIPPPAAQSTPPTTTDHFPPALSYSAISFIRSRNVTVGGLSKTCQHCQALKFPTESAGMCCTNGKTAPNVYPPLPEALHALFTHSSPNSEHFLANIRKYNCAFQLTSFGCSDVSVPGWNPQFRIYGQVFHRIGALLPSVNTSPQFLQIYFMDGDGESEVDARMNVVNGLRHDVVVEIQNELHTFNVYVRELKAVHEYARQNNIENYRISILENKRPLGEHVRRYNAPETKEVGLLMPNDPSGERDILLQQRDNTLKRISEFHPAYDTLQYPILFPRGTHGWSLQMKFAQNKMTMLQFYCYQIMTRPGNYILLARRLLQQFLVDVYAKIESERLFYIRREQGRLRADSYGALKDTLFAGDGDPTNVGQRVILPSSFTGSPRYMFERQQDAMSYVRKYGKPDLFITITTNPKWTEIQENLFHGQQAHDRPDLTVRVFKLKLQRLMNMIKVNTGCFGDVQAWLYSVEFQKRGLPHAHILLWLTRGSKIQPENYDKAVIAEIPNKLEDPELFEIVTTNMIHGPCGKHNPSAPCMKNGKCSKAFPKPFLHHTETGTDSYPKYRRRHPDHGGHTATLHGQRNGRSAVTIDNQWVVPYNPWILRQMNCHLNVELCSSVKSIKYVLKYVHKGSDQATFKVTEHETRDEVSDFINARYIGSTEAAWRLFQMPMNERYPPVIQLVVHLENGQRVYFTEETAQERATAEPPASTLTAFFQLCQTDVFASNLLYIEVPRYYTWSNKTWKRRKRGKQVEGMEVHEANALGRMYTVSPRQGECFFLRLLLNHVRGPKNFEDLRTVDNNLCLTYRDACLQRGILQDDNVHHMTLEEASVSVSSKQMRRLFAVMLIHCNPSSPMDLWLRHNASMSEDLAHTFGLDVTDHTIIQSTLIEIEDMVLEMGGNQLTSYGLPLPERDAAERVGVDYRRETAYDIDREREISNNNIRLLNEEQRAVHDEFVQTALNSEGGLFFLDAPGGCGKTFLIHTILATIRAQGKIVIATASSGLAATLIPGGRTIHSTFKVPLNLTQSDVPLCSIKKGTSLARLIKECCAIVVDEAPMSNKLIYEAMDRSLSDITGKDGPMGGITTLLCGDFRQILPVVRGGTRSNIVNACLKRSTLWHNVKTRKLRTNMRVRLGGDAEAGQFADVLLRLGDGTYPVTKEPDLILINEFGSHVQTTQGLIDAIFANFNSKFSDPDWLSERAILAPLNETVAAINLKLIQMMPGESKIFSSYDSTLTEEEAVHYPTEFLNSIDVAGLPAHKLYIKIGMPVMIMRSLNPPHLMNGTRCTVTQFTTNTVLVRISSGPYKGEVHCIPRISLQPSDTTLPFTFSRRQFPIQPCFALTINKAQGQTFKAIGLHLLSPVFSHGMLYVAMSRTGNSKAVHILSPAEHTRNVVYTEVLK